MSEASYLVVPDYFNKTYDFELLCFEIQVTENRLLFDPALNCKSVHGPHLRLWDMVHKLFPFRALDRIK